MSNKKTSYSSSISKTSDGKYRVNYSYISPDTYERKRTSKRGFEKKKDAEAWRKNELQALINQLEHKETLDENLTMAELIEKYMSRMEVRRRESTNETKKHIVETKILPYFAKKRVFDIDREDIEKWQDGLLKAKSSSGKPYSETYIRTIRSQLTAIFNYAVRLHHLPFNPVDKAEMIGSKTAGKRPFWKKEQYHLFINEIAEKPMYYYAFEVLFWCGLRMGEMLALTPADIDFDNQTIYINKTYHRIKGKDIISPPKTKNGERVVHIPEYLLNELKEYIESLYGVNKTDRIFTVTKSGLHHALKDGCLACGMEKIPVHSLRHSHISMLANLNVPTVIIAQRVGHTRSGITDLYSHPYESKGKEVAEMLNGIMEEMYNVCEE